MRTDKHCISWNLQRFFDHAGLPVARSLQPIGSVWSKAEYDRKLYNISTCLNEMTGGEPPAILAFSEVESVQILAGLREATGWNQLAIVDERVPNTTLDGLDVALLLNEELFDVSSLHVRSLSLDNRFSTRDLLIARVPHKATQQDVVIAVAHWPSRLISEGEPLRFSYSVFLYRIISSILKYSKADIVDSRGTISMPDEARLYQRWNTPCFIMGDFNDEPFDPSIRVALNSTRFDTLVKKRGRLQGAALAKADNYLDKSFSLFNPCWNLSFSDNQEPGGTYYRSEWRTYDQLLLSHGAVTSDAHVRYCHDSTTIFRTQEILGSEQKPVQMTSRSGFPLSFSKDKPAGVSDHFPLLFKLSFML
ncbi:hypothetical protein [Desulfosediminicola flagellatus]|uniref:endonuclease/exonuclease/phosphatase family protein n=1 Tax=Desulfosediminicola flagellatus TaxID=2569541 RepID=UPI0010AD239D|nr:hypothetical protein [Desulfosediminicola flagellatus]